MNSLNTKVHIKAARRTKVMQAAADLQAQKDGYYCASYLGRYGNTFVYGSRHSDTIPRTLGMPNIIFYQEGKCWSSHQGFYNQLRDMVWYKHDVGRKIFGNINARFARSEKLTENEKLLVCIHRGQKTHPIDIEIVYDYLEIAARLGKRLEPVVGDKVCPYYLRIV
jgi:hypothetical protein